MKNHQPRQELKITPHIKDRLSPLKVPGCDIWLMYDLYIGKRSIFTTKKKVGKVSRLVVHWQAQERREGERRCKLKCYHLWLQFLLQNVQISHTLNVQHRKCLFFQNIYPRIISKNLKFSFLHALQPGLFQLGRPTPPPALIPAQHHQNSAAILLLPSTSSPIAAVHNQIRHQEREVITCFLRLRCTWQAEKSCSSTLCMTTLRSVCEYVCVYVEVPLHKLMPHVK